VFSLLNEINQNNNVQDEMIESERSILDNSEDNASNIPENDNHISEPTMTKPHKTPVKKPPNQHKAQPI